MTKPEKKREDMKFAQARDHLPLFKLDAPTFYSGYYAEHVLLGGVWVILTGDVLDEHVNTQHLPVDGLPFRVVKKTGDCKVVTGGCGFLRDFIGLEGYDQSGVRKVIYHSSGRRSDEEGCGRYIL